MEAVLAVFYCAIAVFFSFGTWVQWSRGEHLLASVYIVAVTCFIAISALFSYRYIRDTRRHKAELSTSPQDARGDKTLETEQH